MCFSSKASFSSSGFLTTIGIVLIKKAWKNKKLLPLASTPLWFGIQQAFEGIVWIGITHSISHYIFSIAAYCFVFFAGCWWPTWIPIALYVLEKNSFNKKLLCITLIIGIVTSLIYGIGLINLPMKVMLTPEHHLYYPTLSYPLGSTNTVTQYIENSIPIIYLLSTVMPFFISTIKHTWIIGIIMGLACLTSQIFYAQAVASVWCFFAALASIFIGLSIHHFIKNEPFKNKK